MWEVSVSQIFGGAGDFVNRNGVEMQSTRGCRVGLVLEGDDG